MIRVSNSWSRRCQPRGLLGARAILVVGCAAAGAVGCGGDERPPAAEGLPDVAASEADGQGARQRLAEAVDGRLAGDVGPAEGVDAPAARLSAWDGGEFLSIENVAALPERFVMLYA